MLIYAVEHIAPAFWFFQQDDCKTLADVWSEPEVSTTRTAVINDSKKEQPKQLKALGSCFFLVQMGEKGWFVDENQIMRVKRMVESSRQNTWVEQSLWRGVLIAANRLERENEKVPSTVSASSSFRALSSTNLLQLPNTFDRFLICCSLNWLIALLQSSAFPPLFPCVSMGLGKLADTQWLFQFLSLHSLCSLREKVQLGVECSKSKMYTCCQCLQ